ncbi:MAG: hypothetical protein HY934_01200 [Candidatus Firestonebacteria bacterium]|nr:hypothetical protein [Candidatus Firestonebacteria bacterium]
MDKHWYVIQTKPKNEDLVDTRLKNEGFEVFNPKIEKYIHRNNKKILGYECLFPNYIFVNFNLGEHFRLIKWTHGVNKIVGCGDNPVPISEKIITFIRERTTSQGIIKHIKQFEQGDKVRIKTGHFKDLIGILEHPVSSQGRIKVLLNLLNYQCKLDLHQSEVVKY